MAIKLLLADESITIRKVFQKTFSGDEYELACIDRDDDLFDSLTRLKPDFLIVSDNFPGMEPNIDIPKISDNASMTCSVILLGNRSDGSTVKKSRPEGVSGFVYKPVDNRAIKNLLEELLNKKRKPDSKPLEGKRDIPPGKNESVDQRAKILFNIFESYFNENMVALTDSLSRTLAPKISADIASKVIEHLEITELPKQIMNMTRGIVHDLVPQITEQVIAKEIESIKTEAIRLLETADDNETDNV
jgi:DNA-binding response OmpR family regulator